MKLYICLFSLLALSHAVQATSFKVTNSGTQSIKVSPMWSGRPESFSQINPGQSAQFDSGFNKVNSIRWQYPLPKRAPGEFCYKLYETNVPVGPLNIGGEFKVLDGGSYNYSFGVDGSNSGVGTPAS